MKENQRIRLSKQMLRESLKELLYEKSIHQISVREICENANINRTTFYKYYKTPYDLLKDIEDKILTEIDQYLKINNETSPGKSKKLIKTLEFIDENLDLFRMLCDNNIDQEFPKKLLELPQVRQLLVQHLDAHQYDKQESEYLFTFIVNGGYSIIRDWINKDKRESAEEMALLIDKIIKKLLLVDQLT